MPTIPPRYGSGPASYGAAGAYEQQLMNAERRRRIAEELAQQRMMGRRRMEVAPGGLVNPYSWGEMAADLGSAVFERRARKKAEAAEDQAAQTRRDELAAAMAQMQGAVPDEAVGGAAYRALMSAPEGQLAEPVYGRSEATQNLMQTALGPEESARMMIAQAMAPAERVDLGDRIAFMQGDRVLREVMKGPTPDAAANRAAADARAAEQRSFTAQQGELTRQQQRDLAAEQRALTERGQNFTQERAAVDDARLQAEVDRKVAADERERADRFQGALNTFEQGMQLLDRIEQHPGFGAAVGAKGMSSLWGLLSEPIGGTDAADFTALVNQLGGRQFLEAFESLRGGGQISNVEGQEAKQAIMNLSRSQSEKQFRENLGILRGIMGGTLERARLRAGGAAQGGASGAGEPPGDVAAMSDADLSRMLGL